MWYIPNVQIPRFACWFVVVCLLLFACLHVRNNNDVQANGKNVTRSPPFTMTDNIIWQECVVPTNNTNLATWNEHVRVYWNVRYLVLLSCFLFLSFWHVRSKKTPRMCIITHKIFITFDFWLVFVCNSNLKLVCVCIESSKAWLSFFANEYYFLKHWAYFIVLGISLRC